MLRIKQLLGVNQEPGIGGYGFGWLVNPDWRGRRVIFNSGAKQFMLWAVLTRGK